MIVKDEAAVLQRCLDSVKSIIDYWIICDTGSSDRTLEVIAESLVGIPGEVFQDSWRNFEHNRTLAMRRARGKADYHLLLDADMVLKLHSVLPPLTADAYLVSFEGWCDYSVLRLVSDKHEWRYIGVTHEYVHSETAAVIEKLPQASIHHFEDGGARSDKYVRDIRLLTGALVDDPLNSRYAYYLAQSYRDTQNFAEACVWYEKRALMGGWGEETWHALYQTGKMQTHLGLDWRIVLNSFLQAFNFRPSRLEPIYHITRFYREQHQFALGYHFGRLIREVPYPKDTLFIERDVYEYLLHLEFAVCCQGMGRHQEAVFAYDKVLANSNVPLNFREAAARSREFSQGHISLESQSFTYR